MSEDDNEQEKTVILPSPGGRGATQRPGAEPPASSRQPEPAARGLPGEVTPTGVNPLVAAATPLLAVIVRLRGSASQKNVDGLRERVVREVKNFEQRANAEGCSTESIRVARYALCAAIDDVVLNTPWGSDSVWSTRSMVGTFHKETYGGERFFDLLERMNQDPGRNRDVLELMYLCLSLGFEGRMRVMDRGGNEHSRVREGIYRSIRHQRGDFERGLSPHWRGVEAGHRALSSHIPVWVIALLGAVLLMLVYIGLSFMLNSSSDRVYAAFGDLDVPVTRPEPKEPPPPPPRTNPEQLPKIEKFLEEEIAAGLVTVFEDQSTITVRIKGDGMFDSGKDSVRERFLPIISRVAEAVNEEPGSVLVVGHSDNVPIRTVRFPSNWHLSLARAEAVQEIMAQHMNDPGRLTAEGRAAAEPIASNETAEGRAQNRRIEVVLEKVS